MVKRVEHSEPPPPPLPPNMGRSSWPGGSGLRDGGLCSALAEQTKPAASIGQRVRCLLSVVQVVKCTVVAGVNLNFYKGDIDGDTGDNDCVMFKITRDQLQQFKD